MRANDPQDESAIAKHTLNNPGPKTAIIAMPAMSWKGQSYVDQCAYDAIQKATVITGNRPKNKPVSKDMPTARKPTFMDTLEP